MKEYKIPIVYQKIEYYDVKADNLQKAITIALRQFFEKPEEGYLEDSFEIDTIVEDNYNELYSVNLALANI